MIVLQRQTGEAPAAYVARVQQIIYQAFNQAGNWARGSAYALVLLITCIIFVLFVMKVFKVKLGEIAR